MAAPAVLIVEDEAIVADDLQATLVEYGYDAYAIAGSAEEAVAAAAARSPDLVLMDIRIKGERDGIETAALMRARFMAPVVYLTSHADERTVARAKQTEPYGYLQKPVRGAELRSAIEVALFKSEMERRAREQQRWFEITLKSIADAVIAVDLRGNVAFMNDTAAVLTGVSPAVAVGRNVHEVMRLRGSERLPVMAALERGEVVEQTREEIERIGDGGARVIADSAAPVVDDGKLLGAVMVFRDVSEGERLQRQLEVSERLASLGTLAAGVAHEVNNPLGAVVANAQFIGLQLAALARGEADPDALTWCREAIADVESASARITKIVSDLRAFSRPPLADGEVCDLRGCIEWAGRATRQEFAARARFVVGEVTPSPVVGDATRLGQVLLNLLINAAQAIPPGRADEHEVRVSAADVGDHVVVTVRDTGSGMSEEVRRRAFEPFFTTKGVGAGTGLGLSICHGIVVALGGVIEIESVEGRGTTVRFSVPKAQVSPSTPSTAPAERAPTDRLRILVIDDEPLVLRTVERLLRRHEVVSCERGDAALAHVADADFDVILCDVTMPTMTGLDIYEVLLQRNPRMAQRMVFMTGGAITSRIGAFLDQHGDRQLHKPFTLAALLAAVAAAAR